MNINSILGIIGLRRVPKCLGWWSIVDGQLIRKSIPYGWRIIRKKNALSDEATELDYFIKEHSNK